MPIKPLLISKGKADAICTSFEREGIVQGILRALERRFDDVDPSLEDRLRLSSIHGLDLALEQAVFAPNIKTFEVGLTLMQNQASLCQRKGLAQGKYEAMAQCLLQTLTMQFGSIDSVVKKRLCRMNMNELEEAFDLALNSSNMEMFETKLTAVFGPAPLNN